MPRIYIAPADAPLDRSDLDRSLINPVERQIIIRSFSDATYPELIDIERRGRGFYAWGLENSDELVDDWFHMSVGDYLLVTYKGAYRHYAKVLGRYENERAARSIWSRQEDEPARELLFFLSEPIPLSLPCNQLTDYLQENYTNFTNLSPDIVEHIEADFGSIDRFVRRRLLNTGAGGPTLDLSGIIQLSERDQQQLKAFKTNSSREARAQMVDGIVRRRGHPEFRRSLLTAYKFKCAVTSCDASDALEAAYIAPYHGRLTNDPSNGILLRSDVHTLFDLGKIAVDTRNMTVIVADDLLETNYRILAGRPLSYPEIESHRPSKDSLDMHRRLAGL
ncbi:MAG: HNH endonuclease [Gammaproteobacteria bacterium]